MDERWNQWLDDLGSALTLYARQFVASHADAEESVQDGFIRFWRIRRTANDPKALLFACVKKAALDVVRKDARRQRREHHVAERAERESSFDIPVERRERQIEVETAIESLPEDQREVLVMKIWGQATFAQIAEALDLSPNTAASRYRYAIAALRKRIREVPS